MQRVTFNVQRSRCNEAVFIFIETDIIPTFKDQLLDHWEYRIWEGIFDVYCLKVDDKNKAKLYRKLVSKYHPKLNRSVGYEFWK